MFRILGMETDSMAVAALRRDHDSQVVANNLEKPPLEQCTILGGPFAVGLQGLLFLLSMSILLIKWKKEIPQRPLSIFAKDSSKQAIGSGCVHIWNMVLAVIFTAGIKTKNSHDIIADECAWYWINITIDCTLGVAINYWLLRFSEKHLGYDSGKYISERLSKTSQHDLDDDHGSFVSVTGLSSRSFNFNGHKGHPRFFGLCNLSPGVKNSYMYQLFIWICIVCLMKTIVAFLMYIFHPLWAILGMASTHWIPNKDGQLFFVMIVTPLVMNILQMWIQDSFLKSKNNYQFEEELESQRSSTIGLGEF